jgi:cytidylate kinase
MLATQTFRSDYFTGLIHHLINRNRATAPLKPAADAVIIDTSHLSIDEVVNKACEVIRSKGLGC